MADLEHGDDNLGASFGLDVGSGGRNKVGGALEKDKGLPLVLDDAPARAESEAVAATGKWRVSFRTQAVNR